MELFEISEGFKGTVDKMEGVLDEILSTSETFEHDFIVDAQNNGLLDTDAINPERLKDIVRWIVNAEAREEALSVEIKKLQDKKRSAEHKVRCLKKYLHECMRLMGVQKYDGGIRTAYVRKGSERIEVDEEMLADWTPEVIAAATALGALKVETKIMKSALKQLPNFDQLPGVEVIKGEDTLALR